MAAPAAVLSILVRANTRGAQASLLRLNQRLAATGKGADKAVSQVAMLGKVGVIGAGAGLGFAIKKAADFEQQLDSLGSVSGATTRQMKQFSKQAMKAGADTKFSALEAAQAQTELAKGGLSVKNIMKGGLRSALALAAAGELDLADAAAATVNAMKLFNIHGEDSMKVADGLATAANKTTADVEDFALALKMGGSAAKIAGLTFQETTAILEALAQTGIKGSDAGTSMKAMLVQLAGPTEKQIGLTKKLGISFFDQAGHMKKLPEIARVLSGALDGMSDKQRLATAKTLAGTDGFRALLSIYSQGPKKMAALEEGLKKSGTAAEVARQKQANLKGIMENLKGSVETIAIAFGMKFLPALSNVGKALTKLLNDPNLSAQQKLDKFAQMFAHALSDVAPDVLKAGGALAVAAVRGFFTAFRESPVWVKLLTAGFLINKFGGFSAFTKVGTAAGAATGTAMGASMAATATTTAATGLSTAAGTTAWTGWGSKAGKTAGESMGKTTASTFGARMKGRMFGIGKGLLAGALVAGIADGISRQGLQGIGDRFQQGLSTASLGIIPAPKDIQERLSSIAQQIQQWKGSGALKLSDPNDPDNSLIRQKDLGDFTHNQKQMLKGMMELRNSAARLFGPGQHLISDAWANPKRAQHQLASLTESFQRMRNGSVAKVSELRDSMESNARAIEQTLGVHSKRGAAAMQMNFGLSLKTIKGFVKSGTLSADQGGRMMARLMKIHSKEGQEGLAKNLLKSERFIGASMTRHGKITDDGTALIRLLMINAMKGMGLSADTIRMSLNKRESAKHGPVQPGQVGMVVRGGKPTGDSVHALLERGEVVVNRKAVQRMGGPQRVNMLNQMIPRFATGGIAGMTAAANKLDAAQFPYVWGGGHQGSPAPFGPMDCSGAVSFVLQHGGVKIPTMVSGALAGAGAPGPGRATVFANSGHTFMRLGNRYFGTSGSNPGGGAGWFPDPGAAYRSGFTQRHFKAGGSMGSIPRVTISGEQTALKALAQGALDNTRRGGNRKLNQLMASSIGGGDFGDGGPGLGKAALKALWVRANGRFGDPNLMAAIALAESGGNPDARNPSGASGLWQILGQPFAGNVFNPLTNAKMAGAKLHSQGLGAWEAYTKGTYAQFLQRGGIVGMQNGGDPFGLIDPMTRTPGKSTAKAPRSPLSRQLNRAVNIVGGLNTKSKRFPPKVRSRALHQLLKRIKNIDVPPHLKTNLKNFQQNADIFGDMADRAGQLTMTDSNGVVTQGVVGGMNEGEWLTKQLEALFKLRNALIKAEKIVADKREKIVKLIEKAKARLEKIADQIRAAAKVKRGLEQQLKEAQKHPKKNAELIKELKGKIGKVDQSQGVLTRERGVLAKRIIPSLDARRQIFGASLRDDIRPGIEQVQGLGSSKEVMTSLPAVGVLGGDIFATQMRLRDLNVKADVTDPGDSATADALRELLRLSQQREATSQAQYDVFKNTPFGGSFASGGVVPGPTGAPRAILAHGGETVTPAGAGGLQVIVNGDIVNTPRGKPPIEVKDLRATNRAPLPGRGGGLQR